MGDPSILQRLVDDVVRQVRLRRAEFYGLRGLGAGALAAVVPLIFRESLGDLGYLAAAGLLVLGSIVGALYGMLMKVPVADAARLTDRGYGLQERVSTALEWGGRDDAGRLTEAQVDDASRHAARVSRRRVIPRRLPREARLIPIPLVLGLALAIAPPIPLPKAGLPSFSASTSDEDEKKEERVGKVEMEERSKATRRETPQQRVEAHERTLTPRMGGGVPSQPGDLSALFKDTSLGGRSPDFNSFLKRGDERLRMLEQVDRLPDLKRDFTQRQSKVVFQKAKALQGGLNPGQFSPEKLRELLNEMERLGRRGGDGGGWSGDVSEGMEALDQGQHDRAMQAMERALSKLRAAEDGGREGKGLRGGREDDRRAGRGRDRGANPGGMGEEGDFPDGEGSLPGRGKSPSAKGDPSQRLRANPFDVGVEGEVRPGKKEGIDTNLVGRGQNMPSRLHYLGVIGQYRKMMEESIAREQVPREFQEHVKGYFQALDEK